jgi:hypothetical protein
VTGGEEGTEQPKVADLGKIEIKVAAPPRSDGYRPITDALWTWARLAGQPELEQWRLFSAAARRLDTAHRQFERVRAALDSSPEPGIGSPTSRRKLHEMVGDVEAAVWALDMAITIAKSLSGRYRIAVPFPKIATEKEALITSLRDHYSHIDERAIGRIWGKPDAKAEEAFELLALLGERAITDGNDTLGVDAEATEIRIALRDYLVKSWSEIVARSGTETPSKTTARHRAGLFRQ